MLHQLSHLANWELAVLCVDYKPVGAEIDDVNTRTFLVFEMQIGMNKSNSFKMICHHVIAKHIISRRGKDENGSEMYVKSVRAIVSYF